MLAIPTVVVLFILGPLTLGAFVATLVVPTVYLALRSKIKDPFAATANGTEQQEAGG